MTTPQVAQKLAPAVAGCPFMHAASVSLILLSFLLVAAVPSNRTEDALLDRSAQANNRIWPNWSTRPGPTKPETDSAFSGIANAGYSLRTSLAPVTKVGRVPRPSPSYEERAVLKALGSRVKTLRQEREMTQEELVGTSQIDRSYLAEIENGSTNPSVIMLVRLARGLHVEISDLFSNG